jgi:exopolysaccharide production protein ExoQ
LATAASFDLIPFVEGPALLGSPPATVEHRDASIWSRVSTWGLLLLLIYFALDGVSPLANDPTATRAVQTVSAGGVMLDRMTKLAVFALCMVFVLKRHRLVWRFSLQMKLVTAFPLAALILSPVSQLPSRSISSAILLLGSTLLLYYVMSRFTANEVLELLLILGLLTIAASIVSALAFPQYGLDGLGGHADAWKGVFSAKNYLGNMALFFLTVAVSYRPRTPLFKTFRVSQVLLCLVAIAFSRAATAYMLTAFYVAYCVVLRTLHSLRKKDYMLAGLFMVVVFAAFAILVVVWPDALISVLGKDITLTGRTEIWSAVWDSIAKRPLFGYGYQGFWLGLEGESYRVILVVSWVLAQAQNGFLDVMLEMGVVGLAIVLSVFGFAFRDSIGCLLQSHDRDQLRVVEWYLAIVLLTLLYNVDESFLFDAKHLGSMMFLLACVGLKTERLRVKEQMNQRIPWSSALQTHPDLLAHLELSAAVPGDTNRTARAVTDPGLTRQRQLPGASQG